MKDFSIVKFVVLRYKMNPYIIQSKSHQILTHSINKINLPCFDGKRYILDDGITTLAYGHKDLDLVFYSIKISTVKLSLMPTTYYAELLPSPLPAIKASLGPAVQPHG